jgi:hypothetical protein
MDVTTAVDLINGTAARPGYTHRAFDYTHRQQDTIVIRIGQGACQNSSILIDGAYPETIDGGLIADFAVYVGDWHDIADATYGLIGAYLAWDTHELREFLRQPDGTAPLHPHRRDGQRAWAARALSTITDDVAYGVRRIS